ncbi:SRPBCC family protein [Streptomyces sp. NBC_00075]|uniref:SRPBCC family protein n=1 Tax=Streptomyces sp. NBC_00093 TaxID=2975649 RepID=A0AAU2A782_9ACTN
MKIDNEFEVGVPVERAWQALTDLAGLAPCMPGAQLTGVEDEVYRGRVKVKVGPVISQFAGTARFVEKDEAAHHAVISAVGKDTRGAGNASATIDARLRAEGAGTVVTVSTDLNISGKLAQFGSGMIKEISEKLFTQFIENVEAQLLTPDAEEAEAPAPAAEPKPPAQAEVQPQPQPQPQAPVPMAVSPQPVQEPLDLMRLAGGSVSRRLIPVAVAAVVVAVVIYLLVR